MTKAERLEDDKRKFGDGNTEKTSNLHYTDDAIDELLIRDLSSEDSIAKEPESVHEISLPQ